MPRFEKFLFVLLIATGCATQPVLIDEGELAEQQEEVIEFQWPVYGAALTKP